MVRPTPINYLLVAGEPSDLNIQFPGYWTVKEGAFDSKYSRGAIQFHPLRSDQPPVVRKTDNIRLHDLAPEPDPWDPNPKPFYPEFWFHSLLKIFPYESRERDRYTVMKIGSVSFETEYVSRFKSMLYMKRNSVSYPIEEVTKKEFLEIDLGFTEDGITLYIDGEPEVEIPNHLDEFWEIPTEIEFRCTKRDMVWISQIIVADSDTRGSKLSTLKIKSRIPLGGDGIEGKADYVDNAEINDIEGLRILDDGSAIFSTEGIFSSERNFVDCVVVSARLNTVKEDRDIFAAYSENETIFSDDKKFLRNKYLENSQAVLRTNPIQNRRWWHSDIEKANIGIKASR